MDMLCLNECGVIVSDWSMGHIKQVVDTKIKGLHLECYATANQF